MYSAWEPQIPVLVDAYLMWKHQGCVSVSPGSMDSNTFGIKVVGITGEWSLIGGFTIDTKRGRFSPKSRCYTGARAASQRRFSSTWAFGCLPDTSNDRG